jgi:hypothetical protein
MEGTPGEIAASVNPASTLRDSFFLQSSTCYALEYRHWSSSTRRTIDPGLEYIKSDTMENNMMNATNNRDI